MKRQSIIILLAGAALMLPARDDRPVQASAAANAPTLHAAAGQMLYVDPATGQIVDTPTASDPKDLQAALASALNTSDEGLVIERSKVPGGGMMVNLQGRFQNTQTATVDANGTLNAPCVSAAPVQEVK